MCVYEILFNKKYCSGLVESVDLIFRIVCQIFGQDNASAVEIVVLTRVLFVAAILTIAHRC